jgi:hypothetical protein
VIPEEADRVGQHIPTVPPLQRARQWSSGQSTITLTEPGLQSKAKRRVQRTARN